MNPKPPDEQPTPEKAITNAFNQAASLDDSWTGATRYPDEPQPAASTQEAPPPTEPPASRRAYKVLFAVIALAATGWWAHDKFRDSKVASADEKQRAERKQQSQDAVLAASKRYDAIADWEEKLTHSRSEPFSIQIEDAIIPKDGKPIVVGGFVEDVARKDDRFYLYVNDWKTGSFTISFILGCDAATARRVIEKKKTFGSISVIAQVTSVEKAQLALKSGVKTTEDPAPVEIDSSSLFIARGKCLEVIFSDN